ncbi:MAG: diguanylate cyclase [Actinomycetes bacterium]
MTLRRRLTLVLGVLVFLPLAAGGIFVAWSVPRAADQRTDASLQSAEASVVASLVSRCERAGIAVESMGRDLSTSTPVQAAQGIVRDRLADYASVLDANGKVIARAGVLAEGADRRSLGSCIGGQASGAGLAEKVDLDVQGKPSLARAVAVEDVGGAYLDTLRGQLGVPTEIALVSNGQLVAQSGPARLDLSAAPALAAKAVGSRDLVSAGGIDAAVTRAGAGLPFDVVVAVPSTSESLLLQTVALVVLVGVLVAVVCARAIAKDMTEPLDELIAAAEAVAAGDLTRTLEVHGDQEVRSLADSFNHMTTELRSYVAEVETSRDALRGNLERLGEALSATHDLDSLLPVVLETAMSSVGAGAGVVLLADGQAPLTLRAEHGLRTRGLVLPDVVVVEQGLLGRVAAGDAVHGRIGSRESLRPGPGEPTDAEVLAVPLHRGPNVNGVLAVFDPGPDRTFSDRDEDALRALAGQAAIAVENVVLHSEARQASITDPLTGLWNLRYLRMSLNQEIERATRFERPLAVLMLDLDHFKQVNDTFGHARGDDVLRELAQRVNAHSREVDTFARYGGEEFVLVLPETGLDGATRLAERINAAVRSLPFGAEAETAIPLTVSIGAAVFPGHGVTAAQLLRAADQALYLAKNSGRDRWSVSATVATTS